MNFFMKLFYPPKENKPNKIKRPKTQSRENYSNLVLKKLLSEIEGRGNSEYPFLHPTYSPNSRIPCFDFTNFFKERLIDNDIKSITAVMNGIVEGNHEINAESTWIENKIKEVTSLNFKNFIEYSDDIALVELKSLWILAEKGGGDREFWITEQNSYTKYFAVALSCHQFNITSNFKCLIDSANNFIKTMREDTPFWETFSLYSYDIHTSNKLPSSKFSEIFNSLSIGARLNLYEALWHDYASLIECTNYNLRNMGINSFDTLDEIQTIDILETSKKVEKISPLEYLTKNDLISLMDNNTIEYKKSWSKDKLYQAIISQNESVIENFMKGKRTSRDIISYKLKEEFKDDAKIFLESVDNTILIYNLLSFIGSKY